MSGSRFQTQAADFLHGPITIPVQGEPATLLSLATASIPSLANILFRVTAVRITGNGSDYTWGKIADAVTIPQLAEVDLEPPVAGKAILESFFQSTDVNITVAAHLIVYLD